MQKLICWRQKKALVQYRPCARCMSWSDASIPDWRKSGNSTVIASQRGQMGLFFTLPQKTLGCSDGQWHSWFAGTTCLTFHSSQRPKREGRRNEKITERAGAGLEKRRGGSARAKGREKENETGRGGIPESPKAVSGERMEGREGRV